MPPPDYKYRNSCHGTPAGVETRGRKDTAVFRIATRGIAPRNKFHPAPSLTLLGNTSMLHDCLDYFKIRVYDGRVELKKRGQHKNAPPTEKLRGAATSRRAVTVIFAVNFPISRRNYSPSNKVTGEDLQVAGCERERNGCTRRS